MALARLLLQSTPGEQCSETLLRSSPTLQTLQTLPLPRPLAFFRFDPPACRAGLTSAGLEAADQMAACWARFTSPVAMCVYGVCAFVLLRCFSCSHTVLPKEHSLGVIFFSPHFPHVMLYFSSILLAFHY